MKLKFTKMHGLGNDFVVIDAVNQSVALNREQLRLLADRHFGIGCDQILLIETAKGGADFRYRIFNADGGEVEQCGNGARCFVRYVHDHGMSAKREIRVETLAGIIIPKLESNGEVTVNMGAPKFEPDEIPFIAEKRARTYRLDINGKQVEISALSMGNPHAVQLVTDIDQAPVQTEGALIEGHARFPQQSQCWIFSGGGSTSYPLAGLRARRRGNAFLRHRCLCRSGGRYPARIAGVIGDSQLS